MKKNIVFMGTPDFSAKILQNLTLNHNVNLVITQTDKLVGRKKILTPSSVKKVALELGIEVAQPKSFKNNVEIVELIKSKKPDFIIVAAYGKILPKEVLDIAPCINTHASLLPLYRGASPIQSAILNADEISGVTLMMMDIGLDTGDILYQEKIDIKGLNSLEVFEKMSDLSVMMLDKFLDNPSLYKQIKQDDSLATLTKIINKEDGLIDFDNAKNIYQKYLAYYPWPGIFTSKQTKFIEIEFVNENPNDDSLVIKSIDKDGFVLSCKIGDIKVKKLQQAGKNIVDAKSFLNGQRLKVGDKFEF